MEQSSFLSRIEKLPVPILSTMLGAATLSNIFNNMGYYAIRHMTMITATLIVLAHILKLIIYPKTVVKDYKENTILCSLYAPFAMLLMILGSYYSTYFPVFGKGLWLTGIILHVLHIIMFTFLNVIRKRDKATFIPSWFVTYNGIMVSGVVGHNMNEPVLLTAIIYYGIIMYFILLPIMLWRLFTHSINSKVFHLIAIVLAPCSLAVTSYINIIPDPNLVLVGLLYTCVLLSLLFILFKLPKFFSYSFVPSFSGMTFPMAIGCVSSLTVSEFLYNLGSSYGQLSSIINQLAGVQIYITTAIIGFVLINFYMMLVGTPKSSIES